MSIKNFIPQIWDAALDTEFRAQSLAAGLANRKYQGQLRKGNSVRIFGIDPITIKDYKANNRTTTPDAVTMNNRDLVIDQERSYDFLIDDIDEAQAQGAVEPAYINSAVEGLVEDADRWLWQKAVLEAGATVDDAGDATAPANAYNVVKAARRVLNQANVPAVNRVAIFNSDFEAPFLDYDSKFTKDYEFGTNTGVREAFIGRLLGFNILVTDRLPGTGTDQAQAIFGSTDALAYVSQISQSEALRAENSFSDRLRGLHVFGGGVLKPQALVTFTGAAPAAV